MAGFRNIRDMMDAQDAGQYLFSSWRKQPTQTTASGIWFDLSMSPGNPSPNYYIGTPGKFTPLSRSGDGGLNHGPAVAPFGNKKFLRKLLAMTPSNTAAPLPMVLLDYVGFYGFIDESVLDAQALDNTTPFPRYADGDGLQLMPVIVAAQSGGQPFTVTYTNSAGVPGRVTRPVVMTTQVVNGTILHSLAAGAAAENNGPFLPLQAGDTGVRSVESVTIGGSGDVGLFALAVVKPLASIALQGIDAPTEVDYFTDNAGALPEIKDDAYLNFIVLPNGTLAAAPIHGMIETTWG